MGWPKLTSRWETELKEAPRVAEVVVWELRGAGVRRCDEFEEFPR